MEPVLLAAAGSVNAAATDGLSAAEVETLMSLLARVVDNLGRP